MIDRDLAELYGVETRVLNQVVKRKGRCNNQFNRFEDKRAEAIPQNSLALVAAISIPLSRPCGSCLARGAAQGHAHRGRGGGGASSSIWRSSVAELLCRTPLS